MRRFLTFGLLGLALLGGCGAKSAVTYAKGSAPTSPSIKAAQASAPPVFIGRWAANPAACQDMAWTFTVGRLQAPGVMTCAFDKFDPTSAGYSLIGMCGPAAPTVPTTLILTLSGAGGSSGLTVEGGVLAGPTPLIRCGAAPEIATAADDTKG
jgi:hypothetical protein